MISHLGRYEIIEELGRGAMGIVYKAHDPLIERLVAIKSINLHDLGEKQREEYEARFYQEAKAAGRLNHPNIVTIHDLGETGDMAYISMELMEGRELHNVIGEKRLPIDEVLNIAIQVAEGLAFAHQHGIVHRDIKPSNIMVLRDNHVKIADFGIAQLESSLSLTQSGMIMGSPLYMSPEQIKGASATPQSDIFSLGIVLYQLLTGRRPFSGDNANSVMYQIVNEAPQKISSLNPDVPALLEIVISKCLEKELEDRYQNAKELANDLRSCREILSGSKENSDRHFMLGTQFKRLKRFAIPGGISSKSAAIISYLAIVLIFTVDTITDSSIQLHMLYVIPLIVISFHCERRKLVNLAIILALVLQGSHLVSNSALPIFSKLILATLILSSNILLAYVSRIARTNFLEVGHLAAFDSLTGLHNRSSFESLLEGEIAKYKSGGGIFSLALIDLNNFKELNDSRGYLAGDEALKLIANTMQERIGESGTIGRLGGVEFAILMPDAEADNCESLCQQISAEISRLAENASIPLSTSIGHVTFVQAPVSISEVFDKAKNAMRASQASGQG